MPALRTVYLWRDNDTDFSARFARAREAGFDHIAHDALRIADTPLEGQEVITDGEGRTTVKRGDMLGHRKVQIETRLKLLAKWDPKRYGDRVQTDVQQLDANGKPTTPVLPVLNITIEAPQKPVKEIEHDG